MDPDMVRQQEEAEREARELARRKFAAITPPSAMAAKSRAGDEASVGRQDVTPSAVTAISSVARFFAGLGRFLALSLAGAILGSGLGAAAIHSLGLPPADAQTVILGAAAFFALICGISGLTVRRP
jgi:hypothetical protein